MTKKWEPAPDQVAALQVLVGYCWKEIYTMVMAFPKGHMCQLAGVEILAMSGVSWPQFLSEHAQALAEERFSG